MRKLLMAILALAGVSSLLVPVRQVAYGDVEQVMMPDGRDMTRAARLRTLQDGAPGNDPDTVWVGHIYDGTYTAGGKMVAGGYGPYRVGRGPNLVTRSGGTAGDNGTWDFDRFQGPFSPGGAETDSLQGWWPVARVYQSGATSRPDYQRAFFGLDYGNQVNYVINQGAPKRTFGVVGLWHRDRGNIVYAASDTVEDKDPITPGVQDEITNVQPVTWSPLGGTASAWMGIRSHGDLSHQDKTLYGGTGNYFNSDLLQYQGNNGFNQVGSFHANGTDHDFPGYGSQLDQMLYRDVFLNEGDGLTISFNFSTNMSLNKNTTTGVRAGWFDKDIVSNAEIGSGTLAPPSNDYNFISSDAAGNLNAPCDSFMVYVGAPVDDNNVQFSDALFVGGTEITTVYDKKRRWFSEVLQLNGPCTPNPAPGSECRIIGKEIASYAGENLPQTVSCNFGSLYATELQAIKDADGQTGNGGWVRIVFRVKTNRGFDDENGGNPSAFYVSGTRGAAIVDNVVVNGWAAANGNFEADDAIDNSKDASLAWRSTGKPPGVYFHAHAITAGLNFDDPCGGLENPNRGCNLYGKIITSGDHDAGEKDGGAFGSNTQDRQRWFVSPTINLRNSGNGPGNYNAMGIDEEIARTTTDYNCMFSLYNAGFVNATTATGNFFSLGYQSYPARQKNGNLKWGEARHTTAISFYGTRGCFETFLTAAKSNSLIRTTNPENRPDSLRVYIHRISRCYSFTAIGAGQCSPTGATDSGTYFDNISLGFIDGAPPPEVSIPIWNLINDAFPANRTDALVGTSASFDTCAAQVRVGINNAAIGAAPRPVISGDSVAVTASGSNVRMDMVFRILPGPGNYVTIGTRSSGVRRRPDQTTAATSGDGSFWGTYMASAGEFASSASHGSSWNEHLWNSARMDTAENNIFPTANNASVLGIAAGVWATMYHESDPKFATLGITKFRCVMPTPTGATNSTNINCDGTGWGSYGAGSGWDGVTTTQEYTKIIPDGQLTPGSHVQYFFRKSLIGDPATVYKMGPDTNFVFQGSEGNTDGHRWQQFGVLPDRWKDLAWAPADRHANAPACMLYIDWEDRRGDERFWVGVADTIGATAAARYGAHNGWHARGDQDINVAIATDPTIAVYTHGGQPGTLWDMYGVKASESSTTSGSLGPAAVASGFQTNKDDKRGPTGAMLRTYYRVLLILTGDLNAGNVGPYADKTSDDTGLLNDFSSGISGTTKPRAVWAMGRGFVEGQINGGTAAHAAWMNAYFGAGLASGDYRSWALNPTDIVDLTPNSPIVTDGSIYGVLSNCAIQNDVLTLQGGFGASMAAKYPNGTQNANPKIASIYGPASGTHEHISLVEGFRIQSLGSPGTLTTGGTIMYFYNVITNLFAALNCGVSGAPLSVGENPNNALVNFLQLRSENPVRGGDAKITFGITRKERVELKVYDVTGRLVRTLANREFAAGEHTLYWDGSNEDGQLVTRGVYFYQLRTPSFVSQKKLAVLKH